MAFSLLLGVHLGGVVEINFENVFGGFDFNYRIWPKMLPPLELKKTPPFTPPLDSFEIELIPLRDYRGKFLRKLMPFRSINILPKNPYFFPLFITRLQKYRAYIGGACFIPHPVKLLPLPCLCFYLCVCALTLPLPLLLCLCLSFLPFPLSLPLPFPLPLPLPVP